MPFFKTGQRKPNLIPGYFHQDRLRSDQIRRSEKLKVKLHADGTVTLSHKDEQQFEKDGSELMYLACPNDLITLWNISDYDLRHVEIEILAIPEKSDHIMAFGLTSHREINTMMAQVGWFVDCLGYTSKGGFYDGTKEHQGSGPHWEVGDILRCGIYGHQVYFVRNNKLMYLRKHAADDITLRHKAISMSMFPGTAVKIISLSTKDWDQNPQKLRGLEIGPKIEYTIQSGEIEEEGPSNDREIRELTPGDIYELDQRPIRIKHALYVLGFYIFLGLINLVSGGNLWAIFRPWSRWWLTDWTG